MISRGNSKRLVQYRGNSYAGPQSLGIRKGRFTGTIWQRRPEGLFSLVVMHASRFRNCVYAERDRIGGERKKRGSQKTRATLRREVHEPQEVLQACGAQSVSWPLKLHLRAAPRPGCPQSGMF